MICGNISVIEHKWQERVDVSWNQQYFNLLFTMCEHGPAMTADGSLSQTL
jgi:hypothetical protein